MGNITTKFSWPGQSDHRIKVGAIDIDLPSGIMHSLTDCCYMTFEYPMGRRIGNHYCADVLPMRFYLAIKIFKVDVTVVITGDHDNLHAAHLCAGRICAMCRLRYQTNITMIIAATFMVALYCQQPRILTLASGIRLH